MLSLRVLEALGQSEVDNEDLILVVLPSNQEVVRLDVSVNYTLVMHLLYSLYLNIVRLYIYHLNGNHKDSFKVKLSFA
jgi:hypothetical protein